MEKFFSPRGNEITKDEFILLYSEIYYYENRDLNLEQKMEQLLYGGSLSVDDVFDILCWKTGSKNADKTVRTIKTQYQTIKADLIEELLAGEKSHIYAPDNAEELFNKLIEIDGIGAVYAITFLYFVSSGEWPIYDKFAHLALLGIEGGKFPDIIKDPTLGTLAFEGYKKYIELLEDHFGDTYKEDRNIDRALWAYGHLFNNSKRNQSRIKFADTF